MIIDAFIFLGASIINAIAVGLDFITFNIDDRIIEAQVWLFQQLGFLNFIFPVNNLMIALGIFVIFLGFLYTTKLFLWIYGLIRSGNNTDLPSINISDNKILMINNNQKKLHD